MCAQDILMTVEEKIVIDNVKTASPAFLQHNHMPYDMSAKQRGLSHGGHSQKKVLKRNVRSGKRHSSARVSHIALRELR